MGLALFIILAITSIVLAILTIVPSVKAKKSIIQNDYLAIIKKEAIFSLFFTVSFVGMLLSIYLWGNIKPTGFELFATIFGGFLFASTGMISLNSFLLHYYCKNIPEKLDKWLFRTLAIAFVVCIVSCFLLTDGFADYVKYPLVNGINFRNVEKFSDIFARPGSGSPSIAFYALCILSGAIYVYFLVDHKLYLEYGKHGIVESTFLVALPAGIIGARIFYVIGEWDTFAGDFGAMIDIHNGGLTILGGAPTGIVVGVLWLLWRHKGKGYDIFRIVDIIVPTILIAQAIGRWGNFFNLEVYGNLVDESKWAWLPKFIFNNMHYDGSGVYQPGKVFVPLFLIEGFTNFLGYFFLGHFVEHKLKSIRKPGDIAIGYIVWYGLTRVIMEPLRDAAFNMGNDGKWSNNWSLIFVVVGVLAIVINHLVRYLIAKKKNVALDNATNNNTFIEEPVAVENTEEKENESK